MRFISGCSQSNWKIGTWSKLRAIDKFVTEKHSEGKWDSNSSLTVSDKSFNFVDNFF